MNRAVAQSHAELGKGLTSLATISTIAPWLGVFATVDGIIGAFGGGSGEKSAMMAAVTMRLSLAVWPAAMGLAVGILAFVIHRGLTQQLAILRQQTLLLQAEFTTLLRACHSNWQCDSDDAPPFNGFPWTTQSNTHPLAVLVLLTFAWLTQSLAYVVQGLLSGHLVHRFPVCHRHLPGLRHLDRSIRPLAGTGQSPHRSHVPHLVHRGMCRGITPAVIH